MTNPKGKGRPAQITRLDVIQCALQIGLSNVSMHTLGKHLGVSATALYRHVSSKDELIVLCCDYVIEQVELPQEQAWDEYLYAFARSFRKVLLLHPNSVEFVRYNQQFTPASSVLANDALGIFREAGFDPEVGFMAFASVFTRVTDIVQHQQRANQHSQSASTVEQLSIDTNRLPNLAWLMQQAKPVDYEAYFEDGIKITIEGLKVVYSRRNSEV